MVRLRKRAYNDSTSPAPEVSDDDPAALQLQEEFVASQTPKASRTQSSAARGASFLNAARAQKRPPNTRIAPSSSSSVRPPIPFTDSSLGQSAEKSEQAGKLKRPSFLADNLAQREHLSLRDIYDLPPSPNKKPPPKNTKQPTRAGLETRGLDQRLEVTDGQNDHGSRAPSEAVEPERKSGRLAGEMADVSVVDWGKVPEKPKRTTSKAKRKANNEPIESARASKSPRKQGAGLLKKANGRDDQTNATRIRSQGKKINPQVMIAAKPRSAPRNQRTNPESTADDDDGDEHSSNDGRVLLGTLTEDMYKSSANGTAEDNAATAAEHQEGEPDDPHQEARRLRGRTKKATSLVERPKRVLRATAAAGPDSSNNTAKDFSPLFEPEHGAPITQRIGDQTHVKVRVGASDLPEAVQEDAVEGEYVEEDEDAEEEEGPTYDVLKMHTQHSGVDRIPSLDQVFEFLDAEDRGGNCRTGEAKKIRRASTRAYKLMDQEEPSLPEILEALESVRQRLADASRITDEDERREFKADAYAYLFRSLALLLESTHEYIQEQYDGTVVCLPGLQIITPLIASILALKDEIASWKVDIGQRYKGDCTVRDVVQGLITPLRVVHEFCRTQLLHQEYDDQMKKKRDELLAKIEQRVMEEKRTAQAAALLRQRRSRWQDLHVRRMQCEPDRRRLRHLRITPLSDLDEKDANGIKFERLPVFRDRVTPPAYHASRCRIDEWTDDQLGALVDGLMRYVGPMVLERIFREHCGPGGLLRDFNVREITVQAASLKSTILNADHSIGRETEDWVRQIPVLP